MDRFRYVGGRHEGIPLAEPPARSHLREMDVVGPIRETADAFVNDRRAGP